MQIYYDTQTKNYEFRSYQKKSKSNVVMNYKKTVAPLKYKISCLVGEIHRCRNTNSTDKNLENSLKQLKTKFESNNYPSKLINEKKNFQKTFLRSK